jgi:hypothetical protein
MTRPTITIKLPMTEQEVIIKEWLTGREYEATQSLIYENYKKGIENIDMIALNHKSLEAFIVSIGGETTDIINRVLDLPLKDYEEILSKINELKKKD